MYLSFRWIKSTLRLLKYSQQSLVQSNATWWYFLCDTRKEFIIQSDYGAGFVPGMIYLQNINTNVKKKKKKSTHAMTSNWNSEQQILRLNHTN